MKIPARLNLGLALITGFVLTLMCGCSTFNRQWNAAGAKPPTNSIEGRWEGRWLSDENGHSGDLRCLLTRVNETNCSAHFKATYWGIFRATYSVNFTGETRDGAWQFSGDENLGWFAGGVYHYEGSVTPTNFQSTYRCKYDHGTFDLHRPE